MVSVSERTVRKLICGECGKYLSALPVTTTNGNVLPVCARCCGAEGAIETNHQLTALLKKIQFPCCNDRYGCRIKVTWKTQKQHEDNCSYAKLEERIPNETYPLGLFAELTCDNCCALLNLGPFRAGPDGTVLCGRCEPPAIGNGTEPAQRQTAMENVFRDVLKWPCTNYQKGCAALLPWDSVREHEFNCPKRHVSCPSLPFGQCQWNDRFETVKDHVRLEHAADMVLETPELKVDLGKDCDCVKWFSWKEEKDFLVMLRTDTAAGWFWIGVRFMGDPRLADQYQFRSVVRNLRNTDESFVRTKSVSANYVSGLMTEEECVRIRIEALLMIFQNCSMVLCTIELLSKCEEEMRIVEDAFEGCDLGHCDRVGAVSAISKHKLCCEFAKKVACGYSGCELSIDRRLLKQHRAICSWRCDRKYVCCVDGCKFFGDFLNFRSHLHAEHANKLVKRNQHSFVKKYFFCTETIVLDCYSSLFWCNFQSMDTHVSVSVLYLGNDADAKKYECNVNFECDHEDGNERFTWNDSSHALFTHCLGSNALPQSIDLKIFKI